MTRSSRWLALAALAVLAGCHATGTKPADVTAGATPTKPAAPSAPAVSEMVTTASGLKYQDLVVGTGELAEPGKNVSVHYTGWLTDSTKFDSSVDRGQPFTFRLGAGNVIRGWDEGVAGMRVGGERKLVIPPDLGYGDRGAAGVIPPGATLVFNVKLLGVY